MTVTNRPLGLFPMAKGPAILHARSKVTSATSWTANSNSAAGKKVRDPLSGGAPLICGNHFFSTGDLKQGKQTQAPLVKTDFGNTDTSYIY